MVSRRQLDKQLANEKVEIQFYVITEKERKRQLKQLEFSTKIPLSLVQAIIDDTVIPTFYDTLSSNLEDRGVAPGSKVQLRARFNSNHAVFDPQLVGTKILCELTVTPSI